MMQCRCCENKIETPPVLQFTDMPKAAQNFPDASNVQWDQGMELNLHECPYCGLLQVLDEPVAYYRDVIRASAVSKEMRTFRLSYFQEFVEKYNLKNKKVLEIGAGCGEFLELMNTTGVDGYGIEHLQVSVEECKRKGLKVYSCYIDQEEQKLPEAPYNAFFIMNFLEHVPRPNEFLKGILNNLTEGAVGLIEVPNVDLILKKNMFSEFISDHLLYFTHKTLTLMLEKNGFDILECYTVWHDYCLAAIVQKRKKHDFSNFYLALDYVSGEINAFIDRYLQNGRKVAVWGAGHQALAVIALSNIKNKIEFVVDSADFKQGRYTPGTHLKIVPPETLGEAQIDAVLVMAASYSDEVAGIVCSRFPQVDVAILREYGLEYIKEG